MKTGEKDCSEIPLLCKATQLEMLDQTGFQAEHQGHELPLLILDKLHSTNRRLREREQSWATVRFFLKKHNVSSTILNNACTKEHSCFFF